MEPGEVYEIELQLQATSNLFVQGHCIRIDTSSSNFPHYDVNPNTGEPLRRARSQRVANQQLLHDATRPSHVMLPVIPTG